MSSRRPLRTAVKVAVFCVIGPAVTVLLGLGCIASFGAYMDVHGVTAAMRLAVVGAVAVAVIPGGWGICTWLLDRIEAKKHKAELAALRYGAHSQRGTR